MKKLNKYEEGFKNEKTKRMNKMSTRKQTKEPDELRRLKLELAYAHLYYYKNILKYGPNLFEDDGCIILKSKDGKSATKKDGRKLITDTLKYFEERDEPYFYTMCAKLKRVLDDYDERFTNLKHEEPKKV